MPSSSASSGRAGLGDDSDLRSQLFAPQRKVTQHNLVSREAPLAAAAGSPAHPAGSAVAKSSSPAVKTPAVAQVTPVVAANTSGAVLSPAVDSSDACGASMESLLEELNRRKTHNVKWPARHVSALLTLFACTAQKGFASRKRKGCSGGIESEADVTRAAQKERGAGVSAR